MIAEEVEDLSPKGFSLQVAAVFVVLCPVAIVLSAAIHFRFPIEIPRYFITITFSATGDNTLHFAHKPITRYPIVLIWMLFSIFESFARANPKHVFNLLHRIGGGQLKPLCNISRGWLDRCNDLLLIYELIRVGRNWMQRLTCHIYREQKKENIGK